MFKQARIQLTLWYVGIIMIILGIFSTIIYIRATADINQTLRRGMMHQRIEEYARQNNLPLPPEGGRLRDQLDRQFNNNNELLNADINSIKTRILATIISVNGIILIIVSTGSYYLAGRTLKPIRQAYEQQKRFIQDASHELKTPITALKTSLEVNLMDKKLDSKTKTILQENLQDVTNLEKLTHSLLKLASHKASHKLFKPVNITTQAHQAITQLKPLADQKNISISLKSQGTRTILGDEHTLFELFLIFLDNAIKYTPPHGHIHIKFTQLKKHLKIIIKDTGVGIKSSNIPYIFDRFYQEDSSRSSQTDAGFGLGLSVAKQIIDHHNGAVTVKSKKGKGTTFTIKLPA